MKRENRLRVAAGVTAAGVGISAISYGITKHVESQHRQEAIVRSLIVKEDGFTDAYGIEAPAGFDYPITIGSLVLGKCTFSDRISAVPVYDHNRIVAVKQFVATISSEQLYPEKLGTTPEITLRFDNARQLEEELPLVNCFPE